MSTSRRQLFASVATMIAATFLRRPASFGGAGAASAAGGVPAFRGSAG